MLSNYTKYVFTRVLQKAGLADLQVQVGAGGRAIIPNPPLVTKAFTTKEGTDKFLEDPSLQLVLAMARTARNFWDVGANMGLFSILAREANRDVEIVSIEASTDYYQVLCRNWQINPERWMCLHMAVGDRQGPIQMSRGLSGWDHVLPPGDSAPPQSRESRPMMTLDQIARLVGHEYIDLLKLDVEGMELAALRGASELLAAGKVGSIVLEADGHDRRYGATNAELIAFLTSKDYHLNTSSGVMARSHSNCQVFQKSG